MSVLHCALVLLLLGFGLARESSAQELNKPRHAAAHSTQHLDVEIPASEPLSAQWIVVVQDGELSILPATQHPYAEGVVVSAKHPAGVGETLSAAVVTTQTGATLTTPLKLAK